MFARLKKSGKYQYLQIVETHRENQKIKQRVIATIGRMDQLNLKNRVEPLIRSLSRYSEKALLILSGKSDVAATTHKIGPPLICERLWHELGIDKTVKGLLKERKFSFNLERAIFLTVLHRLFSSGSDRWCDKWRRGYKIAGVKDIQLHHLYRAMAFLGEILPDQTDATPFSPRCIKDLIEEEMFLRRRDLFATLDIVFFDTTSLYFEGAGGQTIGQKGFSKEHRPDRNQMIVGAVLDHQGHPLCCEMWPGNTTDVKTLIPITERIRKRFPLGEICLVADRGMFSQENIRYLESPVNNLRYILGTRMRKINEIKQDVLCRSGRYREVYPEGQSCKDPAALKVKEVNHNGTRYIVCLNTKQARKDAADRQAIITALEQRVKSAPKSMIGNKGYRKYLKISRSHIAIDYDKVKADERFDGKWVLNTNANFSSEQVALKYKELWQVEQLFRNFKSIVETRPIYHQNDATIRGHVFCSFLALAMRKELERRLMNAGHSFEWADIQQDLKALQEVILEEGSARLALRSRSVGVCGKVFQAVGMAMPTAIRKA